MEMIQLLVIALLALQSPSSIHAMPSGNAPMVEGSTNTVGIMLSSGTIWTKWLAANYSSKRPLTKEQEISLERLATTEWDDRFVGGIFNDGTPGALLMKFSPSKRTLVRFSVLRWSQGGWKPLLRCAHKGLFDAKGLPIAPTDPVDVYEIYLQRKPDGLGFLITLGSVEDKLFGDAISLSYDKREANYVWPDDSDHD